ncbi:hypothetical protein M5K25_008452 [Dendrobium thyrsiflorum]|uniref:Uncharacterized protein n=1 Tax=Dendrobium thyrsiflorum TaxID=117978 RepID=A0ABD0VFL0_DENTH
MNPNLRRQHTSKPMQDANKVVVGNFNHGEIQEPIANTLECPIPMTIVINNNEDCSVLPITATGDFMDSLGLAHVMQGRSSEKGDDKQGLIYDDNIDKSNASLSINVYNIIHSIVIPVVDNSNIDAKYSNINAKVGDGIDDDYQSNKDHSDGDNESISQEGEIKSDEELYMHNDQLMTSKNVIKNYSNDDGN